MKPKPTVRAENLRDIQRAFAAGITRRLTPGQRMQAKWADGSSAKKAIASFIKPNDRLTSFERLEIYNKQYWFRLLDCLYDDFPGLRALLGNDKFYEMSIAYLTKYPSSSYALRDLGGRLEKFLVREPKWIARNPKLGREIVRLEWAHIVAFDGEEKPPLDVDALLDGGSDPAQLQLGLQPFLTFLECDYPVDDFVLSVRRREEPAGEASNAVAEKLPRPKIAALKLPRPKKIWLAIHRSDYSVWYKRLEPEAYVLATTLKKGLPLQAACERAFRRSKSDPNFSAHLQDWFAQWSALGWICRPGPADGMKE